MEKPLIQKENFQNFSVIQVIYILGIVNPKYNEENYTIIRSIRENEYVHLFELIASIDRQYGNIIWRLECFPNKLVDEYIYFKLNLVILDSWCDFLVRRWETFKG